MYMYLAFVFLFMAALDVKRRNYQMQLLSSALEINLQSKNKITVRLPTINFIDPASLTSWIEARTLVLDLGSRFTIRV
jgi:hypothetical protein